MPIIVITSNREKSLPAAYLRRCIYRYINFPTPDRLQAIMRLHFPEAEMLKWFAYLSVRGWAPKELDRLPDTSTSIKSDADLGRLQEIQGHGVEFMLSRSASTRGY